MARPSAGSSRLFSRRTRPTRAQRLKVYCRSDHGRRLTRVTVGEDYIDLGAATLDFYSSLVDLLAKCAPDPMTIQVCERFPRVLLSDLIASKREITLTSMNRETDRIFVIFMFQRYKEIGLILEITRTRYLKA